ncbi:MAG TPA: hypothetical protein VJ963_10795 [Bacteroidales bacterium]|nr:hypothetical protein [Bacteroidales bacterium]
MKKLITISLFAALLTTGTALKAQQEPGEYLGLPGDNLNLYAVMQLFQDSKTLEDFERELNDPKSNINNLDLNEDNMVDYLNVVDNVSNNVHNIVIQDQVSPTEIQDVAVFTVQRFSDGQVQIQLTGDEALYGKNYIIEPIFDSRTGTPNPGYMGNTTVVNGRNVTVVTTTPIQIATWPLIRFIYSPRYVVWHSSYHWGYYPRWWHPWKPSYWDYYYGYYHNLYPHYYRYYRRLDTHRYNHWHDFYYSKHYSYSPLVHKRIETGSYKRTYSHPDQRKAGEEAYRKTYNHQNRRTNVTSTQSRRTNVSTHTNGTTRRIENNTHTQKPAVTTSRTTVTKRTTTGVTNNRKTYTNGKSNTEKQVTPQRSYNRTTVTRTTRRMEVKDNGSRSSSRRSKGISNSARKSSQSKASKAPKERKKTSSGNKKSETKKPARRR